MSNFSVRLKELRKEKHLTQQELADFIKISKSSINMYERGEREPGIETLEAFADFFNVDMDFLIGKTDIANRFMINSEYFSFSEEEKQIIYNYRTLDDIDKAEIRGEIKQMLKANKYKKNTLDDLYNNADYGEIVAYGADGTEGSIPISIEEIT